MNSLVQPWRWLFVFLTLCSPVAAGAAPNPPRPDVAVFSQPGFPTYNTASMVSPAAIISALHASGVNAQAISAAALANPVDFNIHKYAAVILPYGNTYPGAAFSNLISFHHAGGILAMDGIPFTHSVLYLPNGTWNDLGNNSSAALFGDGGIGVGGFRSDPRGPEEIAAGDPLGLRALHLTLNDDSNAQSLDPATLPAGDRVIPLLTVGGVTTSALVVHHGDSDPGAIDVWAANNLQGDSLTRAWITEQMLERGVLLALADKGLLPRARVAAAFASLDQSPHPVNYTDIILPTPPRPYPTFQPKMPPPARHLYVAHIETLPPAQQLLLASLQGLVNREKPRIYLIFSKDDQFWLNVMQQQGETGTPIPVANPLSLLQRFRSSYQGAVISDPKVYESPCVAVDLAGLDRLVIATPALAAELHLPIKVDLRGRFKNDVAALHFARTKLLPHMNPYLAICLDPDLLGSQVDDIIAAKGSAFWITGPKEQGLPGADEAGEYAEIEATLADMPLDAVIRGFWWHGDDEGIGETPGVALASRFGKVTTVSDYVANFSVMSGVRIPPLKQPQQPPAPKLDPTKVYVALTMSDGDNLVTWRDYFTSYFTSPLHGTFPMGWGMGPTLRDVAPPEALWYYRHAAPTDEFICDVSGVGYIYPTDFATALKNRAAAFQSFYNWTQKYMDQMDMHTVRLMNVGRPDIARVGADLPKVAFLMPDYGFQDESTYGQYTYQLPTGQWVFRAATSGQGAQNLADQVKQHVGTTRPAFVNAFIWNWGSNLSDLKQMLADLGPDYVAVTPSQLYTLTREAQKQHL